jgi:hypothetical protein
MGRRGANAFKKNDAVRAIRSARDAGVEVAGLDVIVGADGTTTFRVYGREAMPTPTPEVMSSAEWDRETERLRAKKNR